MAIGRIRAIWSGVAGSPLYTNFYFRNQATQTSADAVVGFFTAFAGRIATGYSINVEGEAPIYDETDGSLISVESVTGATVGGTDAGTQLNRATQGLLQLSTGGIVNNRHVRGRLFMAGPTEVVNNTGGVPSPSYLTELVAAYDTHLQDIAVRDTNAHVIWSRPIPADNPEGRPPRSGSAHTVTAWTAWSEWAIQRSRRD